MQLTENKTHPSTRQYWKNIGKGIKRVNIDIPERIWKNVEEEAKIQGVKKREIVIDALTEYQMLKAENRTLTEKIKTTKRLETENKELKQQIWELEKQIRQLESYYCKDKNSCTVAHKQLISLIKLGNGLSSY